MAEDSIKKNLPRERLERSGPQSLADSELLAVILGAGNANQDVFTISKNLVATIDRIEGEVTLDLLKEVSGIGRAKACSLVASLEFARRRIRPEGTRIREPSDYWPLIRYLADRKQETFVCTSLNGAHEVIATRIVTIGLLNAAHVHPREVFAEPLKDRACSIIVAHNHPSGSLEPSEEDIKVTTRLKNAGELLGIGVLDHIIFDGKGYLSLKTRGMM